jgi:tetratricopeptide (TPR) repeat protein
MSLGFPILSRPLALGRALRGSPGVAHYIFAFVFFVRLLALARLSSSPLLLPSGGDMYFYDDWAKQILHGRVTDGLAFYGLPLYAYILAFLYKLLGYSPFVPAFLQAGLEAGTATLLYKIALRVFGDAGQSRFFRAKIIGVIAALGWAFFAPAQAYSLILMPTAWMVFVFWWLLWQVVKTGGAPSPPLRFLGYGVVIGLTATGVATILFLLPLFLALLVRNRAGADSASSWPARISVIAMLFFGVVLGTSPCWLHNTLVARDPVFLSAHSGINFWLGNNPEATGYPHFPGLRAGQAEMLQDSINLAQTDLGRSLKRSEVSDYWSAKARASIASDFARWMRLMAKKLKNFWNAFEYDDLGIMAKLRGSGVILPGLHFGLVAVLAIPGAFFAVRHVPSTRWLAFAILLHTAAILPVFVTERYRLAVVPGLLLFAAFGLWTFWESCALGKGRNIALYLATLALAAFLVTLPQGDPAPWALQFYNTGSQALSESDWTRAQIDLERASAYAPQNAEINLALGNLWLEQGNLRKAEAYYLDVIRGDPRHKRALSNLGLLAASEKRWETAIRFFEGALEIEPNDAKTHYLYARALFGSGKTKEALSEMEIALRLNPDQRDYQQFHKQIEQSH